MKQRKKKTSQYSEMACNILKKSSQVINENHSYLLIRKGFLSGGPYLVFEDLVLFPYVYKRFLNFGRINIQFRVK